jgi:hypothetical protein
MMGLVPAGVGLAYLIYYFVEGKRLQEEAAKAEEQAAQQTR